MGIAFQLFTRGQDFPNVWFHCVTWMEIFHDFIWLVYHNSLYHVDLRPYYVIDVAKGLTWFWIFYFVFWWWSFCGVDGLDPKECICMRNIVSRLMFMIWNIERFLWDYQNDVSMILVLMTLFAMMAYVDLVDYPYCYSPNSSFKFFWE